ncbi:hypothetical protein [Enterococcus hirae]|nr:hypothetical protein [Enterococcus hirae]
MTIFDRKMREFGFVKLVAYNEKESVPHKIKFVFSSFLEHEILLDDLHWQ